MLRIERDPDFWLPIVSHPAVSGGLYGLEPKVFVNCLQSPLVLPFASEHGGFLCAKLGGLGLVVECHAVFTPEGWGKEANECAKEAITTLFQDGAKLLLVYELADQPSSRPPLSFGFTTDDKWSDSILGMTRFWSLSSDAWYNSPVFRRMH